MEATPRRCKHASCRLLLFLNAFGAACSMFTGYENDNSADVCAKIVLEVDKKVKTPLGSHTNCSINTSIGCLKISGELLKISGELPRRFDIPGNFLDFGKNVRHTSRSRFLCAFHLSIENVHANVTAEIYW